MDGLISVFLILVFGIIIGAIVGGILGSIIGIGIRRSRMWEFIAFFKLDPWIRFIVREKITNIDPENEIPHDAIILCLGKGKFTKYLIYSLGINVIVDGFERSTPKIPYKIYHCKTTDEFIKIVNSPYTTSLWIFGHGLRHGVEFEKDICYYCELANAPHKTFIGQYHCNDGGGKSLSDYNIPDDCDVTNSVRTSQEIFKSTHNILHKRGIITRKPFQIWIDLLASKFF